MSASQTSREETRGPTPGPWVVGTAGPNLCPPIGTRAGLMVAMVTHGQDHPTHENACLISAAPDLLQLAERTRDHAEFQLSQAVEGSNEADAATLLLIAARAAIAKAEGRS